MPICYTMDDQRPGENRSFAYPPEIVALLRGTHFLLTGFERPEYGRMAETLSAAGALCIPGSFKSRMLELCHIMVATIPALAAAQPRPASMPPLLIVGPPDDIATSMAGESLAGVDYLAMPWNPHELIVRAFRLLAGSARGQARVQGRERPRILIAEDDRDMSALLKATLGPHAECQMASNGLATVRALRESPPDALILDVSMPILNGFDVLQTIRTDSGLRQLPVILVTASSEVADIRRGMELGADDYIVKPFGVNALVQRVRRFLPCPVSGAPDT